MLKRGQQLKQYLICYASKRTQGREFHRPQQKKNRKIAATLQHAYAAYAHQAGYAT